MRILGIDGGIASVGWAVVDIDPEQRQGRIVKAGSWMFDSPEEQTQSGPKLKNADRRMYRGQRTVIENKAKRLKNVRELFLVQGMTASADRNALRGDGLNPWVLRAEALDRVLTPREWAIALYHIAVHRGFRSNKKSKNADKSNKASDDSKMLTAIDETREKLSRYRTVGEMFARDPEFADRKRNRGGTFTRSILRDDQEAEVRKLFVEQRRLGNPAVGDAFRDAFIHEAFWQRPIESSAEKVGSCAFEQGERRTARFAPGYERFRLLSRLAALRLQTGRAPEQALTAEQIAGFPKDYGAVATLTFSALRRHLGLDANTRFAGIAMDEEKAKDIVARHGSALAGTAKFRKALEPVGALETQALFADGRKLDRAAEIITFNEDMDEIRGGLATTGLSDGAQMAIFEAVERGDFDDFKGAGHVSAKAARAMTPGLLRGLRYDEAATEIYGHHSNSNVTSLDDVTSPVAKEALREMLKQIRILERVYGQRKSADGKRMFDRIHVEMARDVGKGIEERSKTERGIERRNAEKSRLRDDLKEQLQVERVSAEDLLRYELWREQNGFCLYSGKAIPLPSVLSTNNSIQVDHILPWSRFGDDSYHNKTLCFVKENADKQGRTPFEWLSKARPDDWDRFASAVELCKALKGFKKRNYLLRNAAEVEEKFRSRNLNDTRYALRALLAELGRRYREEDGSLRVFARPGELTAKLRQTWGVEGLKKGPDGKRLADDRHHALDAIVLAVTTNSLLQLATRVSQQAERTGGEFHLRGLPEPWDGFRAEAKAAFESVFVARQEIRKETGKAHDATIKQLREVDGETHVFERKPVEKLTLKDLDLIPVPEAYGKIADPGKLRDEMVETLRAYIIERDANKGKVDPPRSPKGDVIRKVRVRSSSKPAVLARRFKTGPSTRLGSEASARSHGGTADRGDMVRVDVFTKPNRKCKDEYFLVPIYVHEVATLDEPPIRAVQAYADETDWPIMSEGFPFKFSLYPMTLVEIVTRNGEVRREYFRGVHRGTGAISISRNEHSSQIQGGIGGRTLPSLTKLRVDRLGRVFPVKREVRTWRGKACISPGPPGSRSPTDN